MSIEINITNRQPLPGVLNLFSHERDSRVIEFILDNYRYNEKDLSKYKAYVSTAVNGKYDLVELTSFIEDGKLKVVWNLRDYNFPQTGAILYQICFKGDVENTAVYYTYKGVIVNRETLDAEHRFPCDYPTIMQQWIDHMHALSQEFGSNITYMLPGESIPTEERLGGRMYYQWLDTPNSRAIAATGLVNLGERPHADSGLYINNVHVYVDDSDEGVYVIDPNVWVNTINNADCGVFATDISAGNEIILLLTAKNVGASGNTIGLKLDVALYGDGKGETNPSGGHVSGSTLTGGYDAQVGDAKVKGQLEDANGNILSTTPWHDEVWGKPNWSAATEFTMSVSNPYVMQKDGYVLIITNSNNSSFVGSINGVAFRTGDNFSGYHEYDTATFPVAAGDVLSATEIINTVFKFIPLK